jgi:hypothetical protein
MQLRSIALGGGGTRGGLYAGILRALHEVKGDLAFPDGIYGTSVGAIYATALAFQVPLANIQRLTDSYLTISSVVPEPKLDHLLTLSDRKGLFPMTTLVEAVTTAFLDAGIDLRTKRCSDGAYPLYILASNMTTRRATFLTGDVPVLDAIRCSACIPVLFEPQVLYGNVYLDGGVFVRCLGTVVPKTTLAIHVGTDGPEPITPQHSLGDILWACYSGRAALYTGPNVCRIRGVSYSPLAVLTQADRDTMAREGYSQTHAFFAAEKLKDPVLRDPT